MSITAFKIMRISKTVREVLPNVAFLGVVEQLGAVL
jgi:hypothetical protein